MYLMLNERSSILHSKILHYCQSMIKHIRQIRS